MKLDSGKIVLVTGAASGIGRAFALAAAKKGAKLVITDINEKGLADTAERIAKQGGTVLLIRAVNVGDFEAVSALAEEVHTGFGPVDVLANVAGVATFAQVEDMAHKDWKRVIDVNLWGVVHFIEAFSQQMIRAGSGHIINVSSLAGLMGVPWHGVYSATKFAVNGLSEVLRLDFEKHGISVTLVCPGAVNTGLVESVEIFAKGVETGRLRDRFRKIAISPEKVADQMISAVEKRKFLVMTSIDVKIAWFVKRHFPWIHYMAMRLVSKLMDKNLGKRK
ncbi:MAG: SDR family oxidoreductase [Deltaproteobacteria bacterium]|nr:SDR family oxidoreductase [Deltaproteobacteria bacterium]